MSKFANATVGTKPTASPHATIVTGRPNIGKTYLLSTIDRLFFIPIEDGLKGACKDKDVHHFKDERDRTILPENMNDVRAAIEQFLTLNKSLPPAERYLHLGIDSITGIETFINREVTQSESVVHMDAKAFKELYTKANVYWLAFRDLLDRVRKTGVHVWLVAHSAPTKEATEAGDQFEKWDLHFTGSGASLNMLRMNWRQWADNVLFLEYKTSVTKGSIGKKQVGQYSARIIRMRETPHCFAKTRMDAPDVVPADWNELKRYMRPGGVAPKRETLLAQIEELAQSLNEERKAELRSAAAEAKTATELSRVVSLARSLVATEGAPTDAQAADTAGTPVASEAPTEAPAAEPSAEPLPADPSPAPDQEPELESPVDTWLGMIESATTAETAVQTLRQMKDDMSLSPESRNHLAVKAILAAIERCQTEPDTRVVGNAVAQERDGKDPTLSKADVETLIAGAFHARRAEITGKK